MPCCWERYGNGKQRFAPPIPLGSTVEPFTVAYSERKCKGCRAGIKMLHPNPAEVVLLRAIGIAPFAVYETAEGHDDSHAGIFPSTLECQSSTPVDIKSKEEEILKGMDEPDADFWKRKRALKLPMSVRDGIKKQIKEPLRKPGQIRKVWNEMRYKQSKAAKPVVQRWGQFCPPFLIQIGGDLLKTHAAVQLIHCLRGFTRRMSART